MYLPAHDLVANHWTLIQVLNVLGWIAMALGAGYYVALRQISPSDKDTGYLRRCFRYPVPRLRSFILEPNGGIRAGATRALQVYFVFWLGLGVFIFGMTWAGMGSPIHSLTHWILYLTLGGLSLSLLSSNSSLASRAERVAVVSLGAAIAAVTALDIVLAGVIQSSRQPAQSTPASDTDWDNEKMDQAASGWSSQHIDDVELGHEDYDPFKDNRWGQGE